MTQIKFLFTLCSILFFAISSAQAGKLTTFEEYARMTEKQQAEVIDYSRKIS